MFCLKSTLVLALISLASALPTHTPRSITSGIVSLWTTSGARLNFVSPNIANNGGFATTSDSTEALSVVANLALSGSYSLDVTESSLFVGTEDDTGVTVLAGIASASAVWYVQVHCYHMTGLVNSLVFGCLTGTSIPVLDRYLLQPDWFLSLPPRTTILLFGWLPILEPFHLEVKLW
jgi:hypothetical protein